MHVSCGLAPGPGVVEHARLAEDLGYERVWCYDSPALYPDIWVTLARIAAGTDRIGLGTAVLIPSLRHVVAQAAAIATLEGLAPGRLAVALGTGFTGRLCLGQPPIPWRDMEQYLRRLRGLLAGEAVEVDGATAQLIAPPGFLPDRPIRVPIVVAANGPKGLAVARELGEGVMTVGGTPPDFPWCAVLAFGTVLDPGEAPGSPRALAAAGPAVAAMAHAMYDTSPEAIDALFPNGAAWRAVIDEVPPEVRHLALHAEHLVAVTERDRILVDGPTAETLTWTGSADALRARLAALEAAGGTEIVFAPSGPDLPRELRAWAAMAGMAGLA